MFFLLTCRPSFAKEFVVGVDGAGGVAYFLHQLVQETDPYFRRYWQQHPDQLRLLEQTARGAYRWDIMGGSGPHGASEGGSAGLLLSTHDPAAPLNFFYPRQQMKQRLVKLETAKQQERFSLMPCHRWPGIQRGVRYTLPWRGHTGSAYANLRAYQKSGEDLALQNAIGLANWLVKYANQEDVARHLPGTVQKACSWNEYFFLDKQGVVTGRERAQYNRCRGAAYIVDFFLELYDVIKDMPGRVPGGTGTYREYAMRYRETAEAACNWMAAGAESIDGGYRWPFHRVIRKDGHPRFKQGERFDEYYLEYGKGNPGIAHAFLKGYQILHHEAFLEYVRGAMKWVADHTIEKKIILDGRTVTSCAWPSVMSKGGDWDPTLKTSACQGSEAVGLFFLRLYQVTQDRSHPLHKDREAYLRYAEGCAWWLASTAEPDRGGVRWKFFQVAPPGFASEAVQYPTGWYTRGTAGTGHAMLRLSTAIDQDDLKAIAIKAGLWLASVRVKDPKGFRFQYFVDAPGARTPEELNNGG